MSVLADTLAKLATAGIPTRNNTTMFIGTVTANTSTSVTVQPDSGDTQVITTSLIGTPTVPIGKRVLVIRLNGGGHGCLGELHG